MVYAPTDLPIGVFDSGVGGLTVLAALRDRMPAESYVYLGDTARLPYGTKSPATVERYAKQAAQVLVDRGIKLLVIACNTASAVAVDVLRRHFRPLPVLGVVEPGAAAAVAASKGGRIIVTATEGTIAGGAYERAIHRHRPDAEVVGQACPLFVALAEEGWTEGELPRLAAHGYLDSLLGSDPKPDCLLLGCTHFPVLRSVLQRVAGPAVQIVDSAKTTAEAAHDLLEASQLLLPTSRSDTSTGTSSGEPGSKFLATDDAARFARVGSGFLGFDLGPDDVELVDL